MGQLNLDSEGTGTPLQYSCLENPMDGGAWQATVHGSQSRTRLSDFTLRGREDWLCLGYGVARAGAGGGGVSWGWGKAREGG